MTMLVRGGAVAGSALPATATTGQVLSWNGSAWVAATPSATGTTPNATTTVPGLVQLAGDLGGTATAPTVPALSAKADRSALAAVATTGAYTDLTGRPALAAVATTGAYGDLTGRPALAAVATTGSYGDLTGRPLLAPVATSGSYGDLTGRPTVPTVFLAGKTATTTTTSTTPTADPDLTFPSVPAGVYAVEAMFTQGGSANANIVVQGAASTLTGTGQANLATGTTTPASSGIAALTTSFVLNSLAGTRVSLVGTLQVTAAGALTVTAATNTSGTPAGLGAGSWLRLTKAA